MKKVAGILGIAFLGSVIGVAAFSLLVKPEVKYVQEADTTPTSFTSLPSSGLENADFRTAAQMSINAVVNITSTKIYEQDQYRSFWEYLNNDPSGTRKIPQSGFGSGVIISPDGYIVTNNHVITDADEIVVTLNSGEELDAELIGTDPNTEVAVIKISAKDLPFLSFGNSDNLQVGDWVMAVGNPLRLQSTVTAGIVSAMARDLGIVNPNYRQDKYGRKFPVKNPEAIESFIQTDAAVNPGNSGGALVNLKGELIGINTAIKSETGAYSGYSFAVPSAIAERVVADIIEYGMVKRAALGITITTVTNGLVKEENLKVNNGVYVSDLLASGGAAEAGIKKGDVIVAINGMLVKSGSHLQEQVLKHRSGEKLQVTVDRNGTEKVFMVKLQEHESGALTVASSEFSTWLGGELRNIDKDNLKKMDIEYGVVVVSVDGGVFKKIGLPKGFVITDIDRKEVHEVGDVEKIIKRSSRGGVFIEGYLPNGKYEYYTFRK